jgi:hypothetical protein
MKWNKFWEVNIILYRYVLDSCPAVVYIYVARNTVMKVHLQYQWGISNTCDWKLI